MPPGVSNAPIRSAGDGPTATAGVPLVSTGEALATVPERWAPERRPAAGAWVLVASVAEPRRLPPRVRVVAVLESPLRAESCPAPVVLSVPVSAAATALHPRIAVPTPSATASAPTRPT
ncbi:MAG: hypothetical protein ACR2JI_09170 [Mycobacterium sp.]